MNASVDSVFPEKYRILSGSALKMIAVITMLIDHIGAVLLSMYPPAQKILFTLFGREYTVYLIFRDIGELLFPSSVFSCWKASGIHGVGSSMEEISFFLRCSQKFRGI